MTKLKSITMIKFKVDEIDERVVAVSELCRNGRNAGVENWLLRQRGKRDNAKQRGKSESTKIYHSITAAVPELGSQIAADLAQQVNTYLGAKVDWRRGVKAKRKDAILVYQDRIPFFTDLSIPVHNRQLKLVFANTLSAELMNCIRGEPPVKFRLSLKGVGNKTKQALRKIIAGERHLACSKLMWNERKGKWFWYLPIENEVDPIAHDGTAILNPTLTAGSNGPDDRPFTLTLDGRNRPFYVGAGRYLVAQTERLIGLRKMIGWRYRNGFGTGHGRQKVDAAVMRRRTQMSNITGEVRRQMINDIVRACGRYHCGVLVYREPTNPAKELCWFALSGLTWDWTRFASDLKNTCQRKGIVLKTKSLSVKEIKSESTTNKTADAV